MSNADARKQHREDLIKTYFEEFQSTLSRLGYQGETPTYEDLLLELNRSKFLDLIQNTALVPFQYIDVNSPEFLEVEGGLTERIKLGIRNPRFRSYLSQFIVRQLSVADEQS